MSYITGSMTTNDTATNDTATNDTSSNMTSTTICPPEEEKQWPPSNNDCDGWFWSYLRCRDGRKGRKGEKGKKGDIEGPKGVQGPKGYKGCNGTEQGEIGETGDQGPPGDDGPMGIKGPPGLDGNPGVKGPSGSSGMNGTTGGPGATGPTGEEGEPGDPGPSGIPGAGTADDLFIHWGKDNCTDPQMTIYSGRAATPTSNQLGGGSDVLCLPDDPTFLSTLEADVSSMIHGVEYSDTFGPLLGIAGNNVPCSVCLATGYVVTIPGAIECPANGASFSWKLEYQGYIMAAPTAVMGNVFPIRYICVERNAEVIPGLENAINVGKITHVYLDCFVPGGLDCVQYPFEIDCAVCSIQP